MTYFPAPLETDPTVLLQQMLDDIIAQFANFDPTVAKFDVVKLATLANILAELRDVASDTPDEIIRVAGTLLHGVASIEAAPATADLDIVVTDTAGYTLPEGAEFGAPISGSESIAFRTTEDLVIANGDSTGTVAVECLEDGTAGNDLTGDLTLLNPLYDWFVSAEFSAASSGGVTAETDAEYLDRLVARLQLMASTLVKAADAAVLAQDNASVGRAMAIDNYVPGVSEIQTVEVDAAGGTFTWTHGGQTTAAIDFDASAAEFQAAIEALSNFLAGDVEVTGGPGADGGGTPYEITFSGQYADTDVAQATTNAGSLTGGAGTATVATTQTGEVADEAAENAITVYVTDEDGEALSSVTRAAIKTMLDVYRATNLLIAVESPNYIPVQVTATIVVEDGYDTATVEAAAESVLDAYLSPATWGASADGDTSGDWTNEGTVYFLELAEALGATTGVKRVATLTFGRDGGSLATTDLVLPGAAPLPRYADSSSVTAA